MSKDQLPEDSSDDDLLRRAAREIRAAKSLQALVPLSASEREQLADAAIERAIAAPEAPAASVPARAASPVRHAWWIVGAGVAASAAAAAVALVVATGRHTVAPLPEYAMAVEGEHRARGAAASAPDEPVPLYPGTRLVITLTSPRPERDALLRLMVVRGDRATLLDPPIARSKAGALEIASTAAELLGAQSDGAAELVVVLGRELPGDDDIRAIALGASPPPGHLQIRRRAIILDGFSHTAIEVLLGGCSAVQRDDPRDRASGTPGRELPVCEIASGAALQLWVGVPATASLALVVDDQALALTAVPRDGGSAFTLDLPARAGRLSVRVAEHEITAWQLAPAASFAEVQAADAARAAGKLDQAEAALAAISPEAPREERLAAIRVAARIARDRGDAGEARRKRAEAVELAHSLGRISVESDDAAAIIHGLIYDHELAQAARQLHALDAHGTVYAEGAMDRDFLRGLLASELGDLGAALAALRRSLAVATRIDNAEGRAIVLGPLADVLQSLGRDAEARAFIDAELARGQAEASACARVDAITNAGWLLRDLDAARAQRLVDQAAALAGEHCADRLPIALVNQGWLLAAAGRFAAARAVLDRLPLGARAPDARVTTWAQRLEAEIILGEDPAKAEQHADALAARATALCSTELLYEARLLRARSLVAQGRPEPAAAAFADAQRALTLWSRLVPLGEGRATFFQRHDQLALTAIPFFLARVRRGEPGAGLALAATMQHSIANFVTSLAGGGRIRAQVERGEAARDAVSKQFDQLLARGPMLPGDAGRADAAIAGVCATRDAEARAQEASSTGDPPAQTTLLIHPLLHHWLALARRGTSIDVREISRPDAPEAREAHNAHDAAAPGELAARIASATAPMLAGAPRVRLYVHRSLAALPLDRSLAAHLHVPVAFVVDARPRPAAAACSGHPRALLVTNPQHDLWAASESAPKIHRDLERMGFAVDTLDGAAATRAAIEARLTDPCTALFHYDGHGIAAADGPPRDRTDDALRLAGGEALTAADVLALPRVPGAVVLNGCTTAAPEGLGLAQAFLLAGAAQVVASLAELPAADAAQFTEQLFAGAPAGTAQVDLANLFSRAMAVADIPALHLFER